jgi:hypothetical protein
MLQNHRFFNHKTIHIFKTKNIKLVICAAQLGLYFYMRYEISKKNRFWNILSLKKTQAFNLQILNQRGFCRLNQAKDAGQNTKSLSLVVQKLQLVKSNNLLLTL